MYAEIAIPKTNLDTLTYSIPDSLISLIKPGSLVRVELKKKECFGIVIEKTGTTSTTYTKEILQVLETEFCPADLLSLLTWAKKYYFTSWGQILNLTIPQSVYSYKQKTSAREKAINYNAKPPTYDLPEFPAVRKIIYGIKDNRYKTFLLFNPAPIDKANEENQKSERISFSQANNRCGASPDNKESIEIYLRIIEEALRLKKSAIILVPEIILTPKFITRFHERLGDYLFSLHSGLKLSERKRIWHEIRAKEYSLVLGARSAIFAPVKNLGLIIVDSEHDLSYKEQERHFHYNARDIAVVRSQLSQAVTVLASRTPSCESFHNAKIGKYESLPSISQNGYNDIRTKDIKEGRDELVTIPKQDKKLKDRVLLIDMRRCKDKILSPKLKFEIQDAHHKNKQIVLFLNRRGFARVITCTDCGHIPLCPNCGIPLVLHSEGNTFTCNLCKHKQPTFDFCPECKGNDFTYQGIGTQKVASEIKQIIRNPDISRLDSDTKQILKPLIEPIKRIKDNEEKSVSIRVNPWLQKKILITTRLGIRDLDYSQIGLFGILSADTTLFMPDFRAQEKTFQELSKIIQESSVNKDCKVIIQTYRPDNYAIYLAVQENYIKFYEQEINLRKKLSYPPFTRLASINFSSSNLVNVRKNAEQVAKRLSEIKNVSVLGPSLTQHPRKPKMQTYQLLVKMKPNQSLSNLISRKELMDEKACPAFASKGGVDIDINIDPI